MADEEKTVDTSLTPDETNTLNARLKELEAKNVVLTKTVSALKKQLTIAEDALAAVPPHTDSGVIITKTVVHPDQGVIISKGSSLNVDGSSYVVVDADTAWEVGQKVEKNYVEEDALCLVLKKS